MFFFSHEKIGIGESHPCSHGGAKLCVSMKWKVLCLDEIEDCADCKVRWVVYEQEILYFFMK